MHLLRRVAFFTFRWILAALLFNAATTLMGGLMLSAWYRVAEGLSMWGWLQHGFGEYFFKTFAGCLAMMLVYPRLQRGTLIGFRHLIDKALMPGATTQQDTALYAGNV